MMTFNKLALATAVAALSTTSFAALQQVDDSQLGAVTGQDGITITISPSDSGIKIDQLFVHDNDGLLDSDASFTYGTDTVDLNGSAQTAGNAGALMIGDADTATKGLVIRGGDIAVKVDTDGGNGKPFVNASVNMSGKTNIDLEGIWVVQSNGDGTGTYKGNSIRGAATGSKTEKILGGLGVELTNASMNVQLGSQPQGAMVLMNAKLTGGLNLTNLEIVDSNGYNNASATPAVTGTQGGLLVSSIVLTDKGGADMTLMNKVDIDANKGIVLTMDSPTNGYYAYMKDVGISDGNGTMKNTIGDVEIMGLSMGSSTISINGH